MEQVIVDPYHVAIEVRRLLYTNDPVRVVIDTDLPPGAWYVVRAAKPEEHHSYGGTE